MFKDHLSRLFNTTLAGFDALLPRAELWARPLRIHIGINDVCNLRCPHCLRHTSSVEVNREALSCGDLARLAPWFRHAQFVALAGLGEPLLQEDIHETIALVQSYGATPSLITNATLLDEATCRRLVGDQPLLINLSIDAGTAEVFEQVRLGARFERVVEGVDRLVVIKRECKATFPVLSINMTLMRDTLGELRAVLDLARRWGIHYLVAQTVIYPREQMERPQSITNREAQQALADVEAYAREAGVEIRYVPVADDFATLVKDESDGNLFSPSFPYQVSSKLVAGSQRFFCPYLWRQMFIDVTGDMMYCCMADFGRLGNIREDDPARLWNHPDMVSLRRRLLQGDPPQDCRKCYALEAWGRRKMQAGWRQEFVPLRQMMK